MGMSSGTAQESELPDKRAEELTLGGQCGQIEFRFRVVSEDGVGNELFAATDRLKTRLVKPQIQADPLTSPDYLECTVGNDGRHYLRITYCTPLKNCGEAHTTELLDSDLIFLSGPEAQNDVQLDLRTVYWLADYTKSRVVEDD